MKINNLPARTWNHLNMNDTSVSLDLTGAGPLDYEEELPAGVDRVTGRGISPFSDRPLRTGLGTEFDMAMGDTGIKPSGYIVSEKNKIEMPVYQTFKYDSEDDCNVNLMDYTIGENGCLTVIQNFVSEETAKEKTAIVQNRYTIAKGGSLTIVQIQALSDNFTFFSDIGGHIDNDGNFKLVQIILGGGRNYYGSFTDLVGKSSKVDVDVAYSLNRQQTLDMNYVGNHCGKLSESDINVNGVMKGEAKKLFRGTIDFHCGCSGSKGAELENVLLIDDTIVNQTIPLILCDEEDVEGAHGATIGRLDDNILLYFNSRGIEKSEAYALMERAKLDAVAGQIKDKRTRDYVATKIDEMTA